MKESQRFLFQDHEDCVKEFEVLCQVIELRQLSVVELQHSATDLQTYVVEGDQRRGPPTPNIAYCIEYSPAPHGRSELLNEQGQQDCADDGEDQIVDHEEPVQVEWLLMSHELPSTEDRHIVCYKSSCASCQSRHGCDTRHKDEFRCCITGDFGVQRVEDWP